MGVVLDKGRFGPYGDLETAKQFGKRVAELAGKLS
jgi:hypothetical protein